MSTRFMTVKMLVALLLVPVGMADVFYVDGANGNDTWDGLCVVWDGATCGPKQMIQAALTACASGDTVIVADGVYVGAGNKDLDFGGKLITLRSANGAADCVIDCQGSGRGLYFHSGESTSALVQGFTIRNGWLSGSGDPGSGGAVCCVSSNPTLRECVFEACHVGNIGGAVYCRNAGLRVEDCTFRNNNSTCYGGGFGSSSALYASLVRCHFIGNSAQYAGGAYLHGSPFLVQDCTFEDNRSTYSNGGGLECLTQDVTVERCVFRRNSGKYGGGIAARAPDTLIRDCVFQANSADYRGGAVAALSGSAVVLEHNTLLENDAVQGGGALYCYAATEPVQLDSNILWANTAPDGHEIQISSCTVDVQYCDVQGGSEDVHLLNPANSFLNWGMGNVTADPRWRQLGAQFDAAHLCAGSPCINTGNPAGGAAGETDLDGEPRLDGLATDIGADEFVDADADGLPDWWEDFYYSSPVAADPSADDDGDGRDNRTEYELGTHPLRAPLFLYVDPGGNDSWNGLAPAWDGTNGPKATVQAAINVADTYEGDVVQLAAGTYTGAGNRDIDLGGKLLTVRSAAGPDTCILDCQQAGRAFVMENGEDPRAVLDGLTIQNGQLASYSDCGGAILCTGSSPTIVNCILRANRAYRGGAIYMSGASPVVSACEFMQNTATGDWGAAIYNGDGSPVVTACTFRSNGRGAVHNTGAQAQPEYANCLFELNTGGPESATAAANYAGAVSTYTDCTFSHNGNLTLEAAVYDSASTARYERCRFLGNRAHTYGAGLHAENAQVTVSGCVFDGQYTRWGDGAGIWAKNGSVTVTNSTFTGNRADDFGGAIFLSGSAAAVLANSIFWANTAGTAPALTLVGTASASLQDCVVEGGRPAIAAYTTASVTWLSGNLTANPQFTAEASWDLNDPNVPEDDVFSAGDYHLTPVSPCIDAGTADAPGIAMLDWDDEPRVQHCQTDIGADETAYYRDCNSNGVPDACDVASETSMDCNANSVPDECEPDCNSNGVADACDVAGGDSPDCNANGVPDECDIATGTSPDADSNAIPDECEATRLFVKATAPAGGNGLSWAKAFRSLQDALTAARRGSVTSIWVAAGVYKPDQGLDVAPGDRAAEFELIDGVALYGGFAGNEDPNTFDLADRQVDLAITTLSGDLNGDDQQGGVVDNSDRLVRATNCGPATRLDGFAIANGWTDPYSETDEGGGLLVIGGAPRIALCRFRTNSCTAAGGAVFVTEAAGPAFSDCLFAQNEVRSWTSYGTGGAVCLAAQSSACFSGCTFINNGSDASYSKGGALALLESSSATLSDCTFSYNRANSGGALYVASSSTLTLVDCMLLDNRVDGGGGAVYLDEGSLSASGCLVYCNLSDNDGAALFGHDASIALHACRFSGNLADNPHSNGASDGGALYVSDCTLTADSCTLLWNGADGIGGAAYAAGGNVALTNCTLYDNDAGTRGGAMYVYSGQTTLTNCIVWANVAPEAPQAFVGASGQLKLEYCDVMGSLGGIGRESTGTVDWALSNFASDPLLVAPANGDLHLSASSPCRNAGDGSVTLSAEDVDGEPRVQQCRVDVGADESPYAPDCNTNGLSDACEIAEGSLPDCNDNGVPDNCDIAAGTHPDLDANGVPDVCETTRRFVRANAPSGGDGSSWTAAYANVQTALADADDQPITEIWVAAGVYRPDSFPSALAGDRYASFRLRNNVALLGGFAGNEDPATFDLADRDFTAHPTVLSGDLSGDDASGFVNYADNSYHVVVVAQCDATAVVDGFTIRGGNANGQQEWKYGGGMYFNYGDALVRNCIIEACTATTGGGMLIGRCAPALADCTIRANEANEGGGICCWYWCTPAFVDCVIASNHADYGAGLLNTIDADSYLQSCTFTGNRATTKGGGACVSDGSPSFLGCFFQENSAGQWGGALQFSTYAGGSLGACTFIDNTAQRGGAIYTNVADPSLNRCVFRHNSASQHGGALFIHNNTPTIKASLFAGNSAGEYGGALYADSNGHFQLLGSTLTGNTAGSGGNALAADGYTTPFVRNTVLWDQNPVALLAGAGLNMTYSDVLGGWTGTGNIAADPHFVDADGPDGLPGSLDDDLHLGPFSPCINSGDPAQAADPNDVDIDGELRVRDCRVDIGMDETPQRDCNANGTGDYCDLVAGTSDDLNQTGVPDECEVTRGDLNCDGVIDFDDINPFVLYVSNFPAWRAAFPQCLAENGDVNGDGTYGQGSFGDINAFVSLLASGSQIRRGDLDCDSAVDFADINAFVLYLSNFGAWQLTYVGCNPVNGDINQDGTYPDFGDINAFVLLLTGG